MYNNTQDDPYYIARAYIGLRDNAYPQVKEQLDMLWHDINNGLFGEAAKSGKFFTALNEVKTRYPKGVTE